MTRSYRLEPLIRERSDAGRLSGAIYRFRWVSFVLTSAGGLVIVLMLISSIPCGAVGGGQDRYPAIRFGLMITLIAVDAIPWAVCRVAKRRGFRWKPWMAIALVLLGFGSWAALTAQPRPCGVFAF